MTPDNPYTPPSSTVQDTPYRSEGGSLHSGIAGKYDFSIGEVIKESWDKTQGMKATFWMAAGIIMAALIVVGIVLEFLLGAPLENEIYSPADFIKQIISQLISGAITYPLMAGLIMLGIQRAVDQPITVNQAFSYFGYALPLAILGVLTTLLTYIGFLLLILPGIYLAIAYILATPLLVEKQLTPWQAMESSRKAITRHWFKVFLLLLATALIMFISAIPLGLGLIWTYPMAINVLGIVYREIFGVELV
ncbi:MAG: hypothetical protein GY807_18080 [Gammaproteobacteria bacterium]|nr:hypothetical protein [Gammaproteobacteria bacterium]